MNSSISSSDGKIFKRYLGTYFAMIVAGLILVAPNFFYLQNSGEFLSLDEIASRQQSTERRIVYGTALHDDNFQYKETLYSKSKSAIVALGSSRMMQFKSEYFTKPFITMGGSMSSVEEGLSLLENTILCNDRLEAVVFGVDFWWFNPKVSSSIRSKENSRFSLHKLLLPFIWLKERKITLNDYMRKVNPFYRNNSPAIGVSALTKGAYFLPDGSYYYGKAMASASNRKPIEETRTEVEKGIGKFLFSQTMDRARFDKFLQILELLKSRNIRTTVFLTPVAPLVAQEMEKQQPSFQYIQELKSALEKNNILYYDFLNPAHIGATDLEFIDGLHGSELTCARILNEIYKDEDNGFQAFLDIDRINSKLEGDIGNK